MSDETKMTIHGRRYRVQLQVFDFTDSPVQHWRKEAVQFSVARLDQRFPKATSFGSAGDQAYYGPSLCDALDEVYRWTGQKPQLPKKWEKYAAARVTPV